MEFNVSKGIVSSFFNELEESLSVDAAIVGGGPSGLVAGYYLARMGYKVSLYERKLAPGGGMWGGAMMFNKIIIQADAIHILDELNVQYKPYNDNLYVVDSVHSTAALIEQATRAGVRIFNNISVEDVVVDNDRVSGLVLNWGPVTRERLHIDPIAILAKTVLDGTGHDCEVARILERKNGVKLNTPTGNVMGERSMSVEIAEQTTIDNTKEIYPGLFVSGMAANGVSGSFRMGPIFGGMLLSGKKVAQLMAESIKNKG